jgi:nicotinate-nucleotide pyrophosphorylase (carboxylating)
VAVRSYALPEPPPPLAWSWLVDAALAEDLGPGDATSIALLDAERSGSARIEAREPLVACGLVVAAAVFERCGAVLDPLLADGEPADAGQWMARVDGPARGILAGERTALNFLQRLCGIATLTDRYCRAVAGTRARILDTRKTLPGWRLLDKWAVRCGGGTNHRFGLFDGILIKDNHVAAVGSVADAVKRAREKGLASLRVQVEVESLEQARAAIDAGADLLLVDNQPPETIAEIVRMAQGRVPIEASGGVTLESVAAIARSGVDRISIGALTHSAPAADIALEWIAPSSS